MSKNQNESAIKEMVKEKYSEIVLNAKKNENSDCCTTENLCCSSDFSFINDDYTKLAGYNPDADLNLGCGLPTEFAKISEGDVVVDLGSGAGNDVFVARAIAGEKGKVIGLDFTEAMVEKAKKNAEKLGFQNVEFHLGDIEDMPLHNEIANVVVSNCVLNLVPNKEKAFSEVYRILKNGGHFSISDVVIKGDLPDELKQEAEMYAGCVSGAISKDAYLEIVKNTGFLNITVQKEREIVLPDEVLKQYLSAEELETYKKSNIGIYSITVYAEKPGDISKSESQCC